MLYDICNLNTFDVITINVSSNVSQTPTTIAIPPPPTEHPPRFPGGSQKKSTSAKYFLTAKKKTIPFVRSSVLVPTLRPHDELQVNLRLPQAYSTLMLRITTE
jgi:hypothetical protein